MSRDGMVRLALRTLLLVLCCALAPAAEDAWQQHLSTQAPPWYDAKRDGWARIEPAQRVTQGRDGGIEGSGDSLDDATGLALDLGSRLSVDASWIGLLVGLSIAVLLAGLAVAFWRAWRNEEPLTPLVAAPAGRVGARSRLAAVPIFAAHGDTDHLAAFHAARRAGRWEEAAVHGWASVLLALDEAGSIHLDGTTTPRGYVRALRHNKAARDLATPVLAAAELFERVFFGHLAADEGSVTAVGELLLRITPPERG